jgi:2-oxoglutarate decarboxylase
VTAQGSPLGPASEFGANEWLVDEMYQRWQADPSSVDPAWNTFFQDYRPSGDVSDNGDSAERQPAPPSTPPKPAATGTERSAARRQAPAVPAVTPTAPVEPPAPRPAPPPVSTTTAATALAKSAEQPASAPTRPDKLRGPAARVVANMEASLAVPTATSVRAIPAKLLIDNRVVINNHLQRSRGGKVSFTHLIGYAVVRALHHLPEMNVAYAEVEGKPGILHQPQVNLGLAIDLQKPDGSRQLLVPAIKRANMMDFATFWASYEDVVRRARAGKLTADDFTGTTISLTNPGTIGTVHSVPRLMPGQGAIVGVGAMEYPAQYQGASVDTLARLAVSKVLTLTSTYDHRVIQGAQSGDFLRLIHQLLLGEEGFYDDVFTSLRIPYEPVRWVPDIAVSHDDDIARQARVLELIHAYRVRGHLMADTDPLEYSQRSHPDLDVTSHGLTLWDLDREFATGSFGGDRPFLKLRDILGILRDAYCRTVGIEYMHIQDPEQRAWVQARVENRADRMPREDQLRILHKLNQAEAFETFLQTKYVGQKRFSLEGGESVIPLLDEIINRAAAEGLVEATIGMPHRGRLNVLANVVGKSYGQIFREFEGNVDPRTVQGSGDVKYHLGADGEVTTDSGDSIKVALSANPSHLEAVNPVLEGITRAKQDVLDRGEEFPVLPILLHGDAAFAGQGVVAETLNLSQLRGYRTGGTIHVIVNNQVGFTTAPHHSRSSVYSTDVARMVQAPIFHVNGDDPEACIRVAQLAFDFRQAFNKDVVVDIICYRRRGHNEGDDPSYTQPLMYDLIEQKRSVRKLYTEALIGRGDITITEAEEALRDYQKQLERVFDETRDTSSEDESESAYSTVPSYPRKPRRPSGGLTTATSADVLARISKAYVDVPDGFTVHPKLLPQMERRSAAITSGGIDWGTAEIIAFGSLLMDGRPVRLAGQDSRRGTFAQRFAVIVDRHTGEEWTPLRQLSDDQASFYVYDSLLSEYAALGFEYGYSVARPDALVLWEAQFGDFLNGAQTIVDEFIVAGESKWGQQSGVTLLLPHGYEGQGPDHSSARIERFLTLAANNAFTVAQPSTPANYFHLLRRQALDPTHRPLIVFTPKSMLRNKRATSQPQDFTEGTFAPFIADGAQRPEDVRTLLLCSGKLYWDLRTAYESMDAAHAGHLSIGRVEQLFPLPVADVLAEVNRYPNLREVRWVQDEPANQGPWPFIALHLAGHLERVGDGVTLTRVSRPESPAPSVGSHAVHVEQQRMLLSEALRTAD